MPSSSLTIFCNVSSLKILRRFGGNCGNCSNNVWASNNKDWVCVEDTFVEDTFAEGTFGGDCDGIIGNGTPGLIDPKEIKLTELYIETLIGSTRNTFIKNDIIGSYALLSKLGDGTYGDVWKAQHIKTKEIVAIKIQCNKNKDYDNYVIALNEIIMLDMFKSCPHIVHMIEAYCIESIIFIVLEYCQNTVTTGIRNILKIRPNMSVIQKIEFVKPWIKQLLSALVFINTCGVIHLDVKPSNILIDSFGNIKLCDFGMTAYIKNIELGEEHTTIWYRAPETNQLYKQKKNNIGLSTDIWSIGCLFVELILNTILYRCETSEHLDRLYHTDYHDYFERKIPNKVVVDFIDKCLLHDPVHRPTALQLLLHPLFIDS